MIPDPANIGPRVRELAAARGKTLAAVARAAGIKPQNLNRLLAGERPDPRASTLIALASALRCRVDDLLR
jgi:transcriptional regulator with XRE-family HTH domain